MSSCCGSCITGVPSSAAWPVCPLILWIPGEHLRSSSRISFVLRAAGSPAHVPMLRVQVRYPQPWPLSHWRQVGRRVPPSVWTNPEPLRGRGGAFGRVSAPAPSHLVGGRPRGGGQAPETPPVSPCCRPSLTTHREW